MAVPAVHANPGTAGTARGAEPARSNEMLDVDITVNPGQKRVESWCNRLDTAGWIDRIEKDDWPRLLPHVQREQLEPARPAENENVLHRVRAALPVFESAFRRVETK